MEFNQNQDFRIFMILRVHIYATCHHNDISFFPKIYFSSRKKQLNGKNTHKKSFYFGTFCVLWKMKKEKERRRHDDIIIISCFTEIARVKGHESTILLPAGWLV